MRRRKAAQAALDAVMADAGMIFLWGAIDFAGGTVVHINAGIAGLVGALMVGKRIGYGKELMPPHSLIDDHDRRLPAVGRLVRLQRRLQPRSHRRRRRSPWSTPFVATAAAALSWMFVEWIVKGKPSLLGALSGAVAGLVAVTPAAGFAGPMGAIVLGLVAGVVCLFFCSTVKNVFGYDDALDVFGIHCVGGIIGASAPASWSTRRSAAPASWTTPPARSPTTTSSTQVIAQCKAVLLTLVWSGVGSLDPLQDRRL